MENQETMTDEQYQEMEDQLWELGRDYSTGAILSEIEWPESWTEEDIEDFEDNYEVVECDACVDRMTCEVTVEHDNFSVSALCTVDENNAYSWEIISQELEK